MLDSPWEEEGGWLVWALKVIKGGNLHYRDRRRTRNDQLYSAWSFLTKVILHYH